MLQVFRTENSRDFCNNELKEFFTCEGIKHETSFIYIPLQKRIAQRKIGDIMDKCRTLTIQSQLPKSFLGFSAMTSVHLVN